MRQIIFWIAPALILLGVLAEPFFRFLFTEKWLPAVPYFQLLCVGGILYPMQAYNLNILNVKGRSDLFLRLEIIKKILITIGIVIAIPFGVYGLLYSQIVISVVGFFINSWYTGVFIKYSIREQGRDILPILLLAGVCGIGIWILDRLLMMFNTHDFLRLLLGGICYAGFYIGISLAIRFEPLTDFRQLILRR